MPPPPGRIVGRQAAVVFVHSYGAVDQLADDVGMTRVPLGVGDHSDECMMQRQRVVIRRPARHRADGIERQLIEGGVRQAPGLSIAIDDARSRLVGRDPQIAARLCTAQPRQIEA